MSDDYKKRIEASVLGYATKQLKSSSPKRKNTKPEKLIEQECLLWMRSKDWDVNIYEAKATYNIKAGRYLSSAMKAGTADCMGVTNDGIAVFIEFKAKGRLSTFALEKNYRQQQFLISKINHGAFACVVDSAQLLQSYYLQWVMRRDETIEAGKSFLRSVLPSPKKQNPLGF